MFRCAQHDKESHCQLCHADQREASHRFIVPNHCFLDDIRTYAVEPFGVRETRFACGSMVRYDHMVVVFGARRAHKTTNANSGSTALPKAQRANCVSSRYIVEMFSFAQHD